MIALLAGGTAFYSGEEGWGVIDSPYFSVITLTTVGYGCLHPTTPLSKLVTVFYILVGIGVLMIFIYKLASNAVRRRAEREQHDEGESGSRRTGRRKGKQQATRNGTFDESGTRRRRGAIWEDFNVAIQRLIRPRMPNTKITSYSGFEAGSTGTCTSGVTERTFNR